MSASLMSCVRENSPPLDIVDGANCGSATEPPSLPDCHTPTMSNVSQQPSTPLATPNTIDNSSSSGGGAVANVEPKRRRFHPLRNLRRIFRRRTITNAADTPSSTKSSNTLAPPASSVSEKNLRSATLSSIASVASASSPSSPLTHQQLQDAYSSQSLPKSKSYSIGVSSGATKSPPRDALLAAAAGAKYKHQHTKQQLEQQLEEGINECDMYTTTSSLFHHHQHQQVGSSGGVLFQPPQSVRQSLGVAVLPSAMNRSFYAERQKLRSVGDSSQELDSSGNDSCSATGIVSVNNTASSGVGSSRANGCISSEITDSQRSLSEGRLVDNDYCHDPLSQSHDSVFSESASASLFSNRDYQAELSDVLRKRNRNRQDASEEDLGLPRSPSSPQRRSNRSDRSQHATTCHNNNNNNKTTPSSATGNQSEVSSLSLLSMNSVEGDDILAASTANNSTISTKENLQERSMAISSGGRSTTRPSTQTTTSVTPEIGRYSTSGSFVIDSGRDESDFIEAKCERLSHSAAKHKMALRPAKKKGPSRQHRRTLETSIPEANEDSLRFGGNPLLDISEHDLKVKTRSLPPSVNSKILEQHADESQTSTNIATPLKSKIKCSVSSKETIPNVKRSKIENHEKSTEHNRTTIASSSNMVITAATNLFGLRTLTAKATALFEPPQESSTDPTPSEQELKKEKEKDREKESRELKDIANDMMDTSESGFLLRLIQRNSKRSIPRSSVSNNSSNVVGAGEHKSDTYQIGQESNTALHLSSSCFDMKPMPELSLTKLDKSRSALNYEQNIEQARKAIKREIMSVGTAGLNAMLSPYHMTPYNSSGVHMGAKDMATSQQKPKSGAAARQRYLPQDIGSLDRKTSSNAIIANSESYSSQELFDGSSTSSILSQCSQKETFQSTSIIREITASQASSVNSMNSIHKSEHHFEKKPKIVGLSAFQQKISRSNDSVGRYVMHGNGNSSNSTASLDSVGETIFINYEKKQRKALEKSRSFRTYQEDSHSITSALHNNMPSLPDLTLNLRVPYYNEFALHERSPPDLSPERSLSLGFEVNDIASARPTARVESTGDLLTSNHIYSKNTAAKSTSTQEHNIEQDSTSDLLVRSPFINVLRKPTSTNVLDDKLAGVTVCNNNSRKCLNTTKASPISLIAVLPPKPEAVNAEQPVPKVLDLRGSNASIDTSTSTDDLKLTSISPTGISVPLREKAKVKANAASGRDSINICAAGIKDTERKSAPPQGAHAHKAHSFKIIRHSSSLVDSPPGSQNDNELGTKINESASGCSSPNGDGVPEFMRIQLNRVDPARMAKSANLVLAKNVRETHSPPQHGPKDANERSINLDDLSLRRLSNESVEIIEKPSPTEVDKQKQVFDMNQNNNSNGNSNSNQSKSPSKMVVSALPPRSPVKKQQTVPTTPATLADIESSVLLRTKPPEMPAETKPLSINKLSLQERKRLFMGEEKLKADKHLEDLRNERKKSITEEVYRKSLAKSDERLETSEKTAADNTVMLRKKSLCATTQTSVSSLNGSSITTNGNRDDPTPELMKVFARRSLKVKDDDINALSDKLHASSSSSSDGSSSSAKKFVPKQQNVDSDKENQSASEEKLDKLPKIELTLEQQSHGGGKLTNGINNRNSLADFRTKSVVGCGMGIANGLSLNNSNNNNNHLAATSNQNCSGQTNHNTTGSHANINSGNRSFLPPIKVAGFRTISIERNSGVSKVYPSTPCDAQNINNNNNNNNNNNKNNNPNNNNHNNHQQPQQIQQQNSKAIERQLVNIKLIDNSTPLGGCNLNASSHLLANNSKSIERSATVSEFKGIHQRRAEWEQRAKEALK